MEQATIAALLEKYWLAETTVEEERMLAEYFSQPDIAPEWEPLRQIFRYFGQEAEIVASPELGTKILDRIHQMEAEAPAPVRSPADPVRSPETPVRSLRRYYIGYAAAAAVIFAISLFLMIQPSRPVGPAAGTEAGAIAHTGLPAAPSVIKDTYDDPKQALAAIQKALRTVSQKMNRGKKITERQIDRMSDTWQTAITN
jgi:hypothetical protein